MSSQSRTSTADHLNLINLPVEQRNRLCSVLDQNKFWKDLGKLMQFNDFEISVRNINNMLLII